MSCKSRARRTARGVRKDSEDEGWSEGATTEAVLLLRNPDNDGNNSPDRRAIGLRGFTRGGLRELHESRLGACSDFVTRSKVKNFSEFLAATPPCFDMIP